MKIPYFWVMSNAKIKTYINQLLHGITDDSVLKAVYTLQI
jgi:hypothetical protein